MVAGQPGGTAERATLLNFLTQPGTAQGPTEALEKLRKYSRWRSRAEQLQVSLPAAGHEDKEKRQRVRKVKTEEQEGMRAPYWEEDHPLPRAAPTKSQAIAAIKSLRISKLHYVAKLSKPEDALGGLLDGGATTSLRQAVDSSEWQAASPVTVHLASGETDSLRIAPSGILLAEPSELSNVQIAPIVALHQLIGCPEVSKELALMMIEKIEGAAGVSKPNVNRLSGPLEDGRILVKVLDETRVEAVGDKPRFNRRCRRTLSRSEGIVVVVGDPKAYIGTVPSGWSVIRLSHHEVRDTGIPAFLFELAQLGLIRQVVCTDLPRLFPVICYGGQSPDAKPSMDALVLLRLLHLCGQADRGRERAGFKASPFQNVRHGVVKSLMYHQHQCREYDGVGPYANGNHEKLKKVRYCLHAVLTVPVLVSDILKQEYDYEPSDPGEGEQQDASNSQVGPLGNDGAELSVSAMKSSPPDAHDVPGAWEVPEEGFVEDELPKRVGDGDAMSEKGEDDDDDGAATGEVPLKEVRMLEVPYMIPLPDKKAKTVTNALKEVLADLAYWGLPVRRVHTDKGAEFTNVLWRQLLADHQIRRTTTVGSDFKANGRTEAHIGRAKGLTRVLLAAASADDADWAFAMRHAVFSMRSQVFTSLGFPQREPIPFYTKVWVRKKEWTLHLWAPRCIEARVMSPSESAPGGYVVHLQPSHPADDGIRGYFETTALIQGVRAKEPVFEASGEVSVVPPSEVRKGMPVTEESSKTPAHSMPSGPSSRLRRKTPDPLCLDPPHAVRALVASLEALSKDLLHRGLYDSASWTQVLRLLPHKPIRRGSVSALGSGARYRSFGMFAHGGVLGVTTASRQFPHTQRYLLAVLRHHHPQATFTSFVVSVNCSSPVHRDYFNDPDSLNYVVGGAEHLRGGLWIEVGSEVARSAAPGALHFREVAPRRWLPGMMWDTVGASFSFPPHRFHAGDSWSGQKYLLVAFTLNRCVRASSSVVTELASADFPLPSCCPAFDAGGGAHSKFSLNALIGPHTSAQEPSSGAGLSVSVDEVDAVSDFSEEASGLDSVGKVESELWFEAAEKVSFLQVEVKRELALWRPAISAEYDSLRVKGRVVLRLPSKGVFTRKAVTGGIDASALRVSLAFISQHPDWEELIVLDPPRIFQLAGVVSKWVGDTVICLRQLVSEPNAWLLVAESEGIVGLLVVYVDDLMVGGVTKYASAILAEIRSIWQCSEPDQLSPKSPVRFCGVEIERQGRALLIHQASYIEDVVKRYEESLGAPLVETSCPFPKVQDPEEPESSSPVALRKAQALAGELLWVSGKTRVDIVYGVARVTSLVSRCPELAFKLGLHILCYLKGTKRIALKYQCTDDQPPHGVHNERRVTALPYLLESFTDASFAPAGDRSFEAGLVQVGRNLVFWSAGKQPFTALSTAEAELLGVLEGGFRGFQRVRPKEREESKDQSRSLP
ncbi:unnamed protein product [Symbiodinium necroappetens]|uniref:Retrovirus-related Pol polyprotein from transposon TNT 1-94 n=1 Tax=Symbiodinium necroappetens TaxID=1628268 RepID=A0A812RR25_9DINO|nr:unnamed protein product [Symbiodinium necroappetens]